VLWQRTVDAVATEFPAVSVDYLHVDAATIFLVTNPSRFDVIVTDNLFGDILTDLAGAIGGGIGLAASGNLNPDKTFPSMFEPVHGSAPDIAGRQKANPTAAILPPRFARSRWIPRRRPLPFIPQFLPTSRPEGMRRAPPPPSATRSSAFSRRRVCNRRLISVVSMTSLEFHRHLNLQAKGDAERDAILANPVCDFMTDHMVDICWSEKGGWHRPRIQPYGPIEPDPAAAVLHYGQEIFEGLKAYRHADGSIWTFRSRRQCTTLPGECGAHGASRTSGRILPREPSGTSSRSTVIGCHRPPTPASTLRPFMFGKEAFLGVRPAKKIAFYVIAGPAGPYA